MDAVVSESVEDHPCMCGDYEVTPSWHSFLVGSPLHVRGLLVSESVDFPADGITPACAGTTHCFLIYFGAI